LRGCYINGVIIIVISTQMVVIECGVVEFHTTDNGWCAACE